MSTSSSMSLTKRPVTTNGQVKAVVNIWQVMGYTIPRGRCVHKPSLLQTGCPCLRFMLNPLQAGSTFTCDGCGHHASFHKMKNDDEPEPAEGEGMQLVVNGKRKRAIGDDEEAASRKSRG